MNMEHASKHGLVNHDSHNRKIYTSINIAIHEVRCYDKLANSPITREQFYFAYNHSIPDKNGCEWSVTVL